jgi:hypothetical protein
MEYLAAYPVGSRTLKYSLFLPFPFGNPVSSNKVITLHSHGIHGLEIQDSIFIMITLIQGPLILRGFQLEYE